MANNVAKYRPYLTIAQIDALINLLQFAKDCSYVCQEGFKTEEGGALDEATKTLKLLQIKVGAGAVSSSYVPTGNKPGPVSVGDRLMAPEPVMSYEQALIAHKFYSDLSAHTPPAIQSIIDNYKHKESSNV
jgi:hypothetical protein